MKIVFAVLALTVATSGTALAGETAVVHGTAYIGCAVHRPIPGAAIEFTAASGNRRVVYADARGHYAAVGLEPGEYEIRWLKDGPQARRTVRIDADETATADLGAAPSLSRAGNFAQCTPERVAVDPPLVDRYSIR